MWPLGALYLPICSGRRFEFLDLLPKTLRIAGILIVALYRYVRCVTSGFQTRPDFRKPFSGDLARNIAHHRAPILDGPLPQ